jgi:hypothetical protein
MRCGLLGHRRAVASDSFGQIPCRGGRQRRPKGDQDCYHAVRQSPAPARVSGGSILTAAHAAIGGSRSRGDRGRRSDFMADSTALTASPRANVSHVFRNANADTTRGPGMLGVALARAGANPDTTSLAVGPDSPARLLRMERRPRDGPEKEGSTIPARALGLRPPLRAASSSRDGRAVGAIFSVRASRPQRRNFD